MPVLNTSASEPLRRPGRGRGDLVVTLHVETPRRLSRKARDLLRDLAGEEERGRAEGVGLFDRVKDLIG